MYVTAVTPLVDPGTGKNWLFVKVDTSDGISGWGECYTADRDQSIVAHVHQLSRYLVERSPLHIKHFTYMAYNDFAGKRGSMELYSAVSGIEQALWDIAGKRFGVPVYNLWAGPVAIKSVCMPMAGTMVPKPLKRTRQKPSRWWRVVLPP